MKKWFILLLLLSGLVGIDSINSLVFANETTQMVRNVSNRLSAINKAIGIEEQDVKKFKNQLSEIRKSVDWKKANTPRTLAIYKFQNLIASNPINALELFITTPGYPGLLSILTSLNHSEKKILITIGNNFQQLREYQKSNQYLYYFMEKGKNETSPLKREIMLMAAANHRAAGELKKSNNILENLITECRSAGNDCPDDIFSAIFSSKFLNDDLLGDNEQAEKSLFNLLRMSQKTSEPLQIASASNQIGLFYLKLSEYSKALKYLGDSVKILKKTVASHKEAALETHYGFKTAYQYAMARQYIGLVYLNINQFDHAEKNILGAMNSLDRLAALNGYSYLPFVIDQIHGSQCYIHSLMGNFYFKKRNDYDSAYTELLKALNIAEQTNYAWGQSVALTGIGEIEYEKGQFDQALSYFKRALNLSGKLYGGKDLKLKASILLSIGKSWAGKSDYNSAQNYFEDAIDICKENKITVFLWEIYKNWAGVCTVQKQYLKAYQLYEKALAAIEKERISLSDEDARLSYMEDKFSVYDDFIELLHLMNEQHPQKKYNETAFEIFERKQARVFLEKMGRSFSEKNTGIPGQWIRQKESLGAKKQELKNQIKATGLLNKNLKTKNEKEQLQTQLTTTNEALDRITKKIKQKNPEFYNIRYPQPSSVKAVQNNFLKQDEFILAYNVAEQFTTLWAVGKDQFSQFKIALTRNELQKAIQEIKKELNYENARTYTRSISRFKSRTSSLCQKLMPALVMKEIRQKKKLYIIPTKELYRLPFGALATPEENAPDTYLIEKVSIAYISSAALLGLFSNRPQGGPKQEPLIGFGNPEYRGEAPSHLRSQCPPLNALIKTNYIKQTRGGLSPLPQSEWELKEIATALGVKKSAPVLNFGINASESRIKHLNEQNKLKKYKYILFACHGLLPGEIRGLTEPAIALSQPDPLEKENSEKYDGFLTMTEVFNFKMHADLTLLSACSTGDGMLYEGEGIRGMARAFMYAGSQTVAVNLWQVDSQAAALLSAGLFKQIEAGHKKSEALRLSKLDMIQQKKGTGYAHPYYWAPLILFGNGHN